MPKLAGTTQVTELAWVVVAVKTSPIIRMSATLKPVPLHVMVKGCAWFTVVSELKLEVKLLGKAPAAVNGPACVPPAPVRV